MIGNLSLKTLFPLLLTVWAGLQVLFAVLYHFPSMEKAAIEALRQDVFHQAEALQFQVDDYAYQDKLEAIRSTLAYYSIDPDIRRLLIIDELDGRVLASHRPKMEGAPIKDVMPEFFRLHARADYSPAQPYLYHDAAAETATAIFPLRLAPLPDSVRPRHGHLVVTKRMGYQHLSQQREEEKWLLFIVTTTLVMAFLLWLFLHRRVEMRVRALTDMAAAMAEGRLDSAGIGGRDELGEIGAALQSAAKKIATGYAALNEKDHALQTSMEFTASGAWEWDMQNKTLRLSPAAAKLLGLGDEEIHVPEKDVLCWLAPEDRLPLHDAIRQCVVWRQRFSFECRLSASPEMHFRWFILEGDARRDAQGKAVVLLGFLRDIDQQKKSRARINEAVKELEYRQYALDQHSIVSVTDAMGTILSVNEKFEEISQYRATELIGKTHREVNSGRHSASFWSALWQTISSGKVWRGEICNRRRNGDLYWVDTSIVPHFNRQGVIDRYTSIRTDITHRKQAELNMQRSEHQLQNAHRIAGLGSWQWDLLSNEWSCSEALHGILCAPFAEGEEIKTHLLNMVHPDDRSRFDTKWRQAMQKGTSELVHRFVSAEGGVRYVFHRLEVTRDKQEPVLCTGVLQDITSTRRLDKVITAIAHGISGEVGNDFIGALLGGLANALDASVAFIAEPAKAGLLQTSVLLKEGRRVENVQISLHDGPWEVLLEKQNCCIDSVLLEQCPGCKAFDHPDLQSCVGSPIVDPQGKLLGVCVLLFNQPVEDRERLLAVTAIYSRLAAAELLRVQFNDEWRQMQLRLRQSEKMEALGQLTGGVAHDFNNMLACINGYGSLLSKSELIADDEKLSKYLHEILHAGERARELVAQMLTFSRADQSEVQWLIPGPVVKEASKMLNVAMPSTVELVMHVDADSPPIKAKPVELHQLVMNLAINARDAMGGRGKLEISLATQKMQETCASCGDAISGNYVVLSVCDEGGGIDEKSLAHIFDPFFTTKEVGKGTGMGLSVVHGIVHSHGGHVGVQAGSQGSCFYLYFPVSENATSHARQSVPAAREHEINGGGKRVLVVDDDTAVASFISQWLEQFNFAVSISANSQDAWSLFEKSPQDFDLVITDQTMPGMTGAELAQRMLDKRAGIPIILCTGYSEEVNADKAKRLGIGAFLQKPLDTAKLRMSIKELLPA